MRIAAVDSNGVVMDARNAFADFAIIFKSEK